MIDRPDVVRDPAAPLLRGLRSTIQQQFAELLELAPQALAELEKTQQDTAAIVQQTQANLAQAEQ